MIEILMQNYGITYEHAVYLMKLPTMEAVEILNKLKGETNELLKRKGTQRSLLSTPICGSSGRHHQEQAHNKRRITQTEEAPGMEREIYG